MAWVLIRMRAAITARGQAGGLAWGGLVLLAVLAVSAAGSLAAGLHSYRDPGAGPSVLATLNFGWLAGWVSGPVVTGDDAALRLDYFKLLPVSTRKLGYAMLAAAFANVGLIFTLVAFGGLVAAGARFGTGPALAGAAGMVLEAVLAVVASTVAIGVFGPVISSRRGRDFGSFLVAVVITLLACASSAVPLVARRLTSGQSPWLSDLVRALPSGWAAAAVDAARRGAWGQAGLALGGLAVLIAVLAAIWPALLRRRLAMPPGGTSRRRAASRAAGGSSRASSPLGAVVGKELKLYARSALRSVLLLISFMVGLLVAVIPVLQGKDEVLPFGGLIFAAIAAACFINMFGDDGTSLWLTLMVPGAVRTEARGRLLAWLAVTGPASLVLTVVLTAVSGQGWAWPVVLSGVVGLSAGAAGLLVLASVLDVQPPDPDGGPSPRRVLNTHLALVAVPVVALWPAVLLLLGGVWTGQHWVQWLALPVEAAWSALLLAWTERSAVRRLEARGPEYFARVAGHATA